MSKKKTLEDIFNDDDFGILDSKAKASNIKTEDERLVESFQEINAFFEKYQREPKSNEITEFKLLSRLKNLRADTKKIEILKPFDKFNLLGEKEEITSVEDILNDDELGILDTDETLNIFKIKNVPKQTDRAETDFVAQRKPMDKDDFAVYEEKFKQIHKELNEGKRSLKNYENADKNLKAGNFYLLNGLLLYFEEANIEKENKTLPSGNRIRKDGRTKLVFENGTYSNMLYRSLDKALLNKKNDGKIVTQTEYGIEQALFNKANAVNETDVESGWIYIAKSKSSNPKISALTDLYKIGYSTVPVKDRVKNAAKQSTYLMAEVQVITTFKCYNLNAQKFEQLVQRFFAKVCLNIDVFDEKGKRYMPREWFIAPLGIIEKVVELIISGEIVNYSYDEEKKVLIKY